MRTRKRSQDEDDKESAREKAKWLALYHAPDNVRADRAANMMYNGARGLLTSHVIKNLDRLDELLKLIRAKAQTREHGVELLEFAMEEVYDQVKIIAFFEHWMKSILLANGIWIHGFDSKRLNSLRNSIKKRPLRIADVLATGIHAAEVSEYTIGMSVLLQPSYLDVINLPQDLVDVAIVINDDRGKVHLKHGIELVYMEESVHDLRKLKAYVSALFVEMKKAQRIG